MHAEFWYRRWERSEIGFHNGEVNPDLQQYWQPLNVPAEAQVLVPLCGKSLDMAWLAGQGHQVLGVELSQRAVEDFFSENGLQPEISVDGAFKCYQSGNLQIYCGDIFALTAQQVGQCQGLYDRAALIALPPPMRERYAAHLSRILPSGCQGLLVSLDYEQEQLSGPPFAVSDAEVQRLFSADWQLNRLQQLDVLGKSWRYLRGDLTRLEERVYWLSK